MAKISAREIIPFAPRYRPRHRSLSFAANAALSKREFFCSPARGKVEVESRRSHCIISKIRIANVTARP